MKHLKELTHKISVIVLSLKTILEIDRKYLFLLVSSMIIIMIQPFLDIYLLRNVISLAFEKRDKEAAIYCLLLFVIVMIVLNSLKSLVMWYRSNHYIRFGHYFDVLNSKKSLNISYEKLQEKETQDAIMRAARGCSAIARVGEYASELISNLVQIIGTVVIMISFCKFYVILIIALAFICYKVDKLINTKIYENEKKGDTPERKIDYFLKVILDTRTGKELRLFNAAALFKKKYEDAENELYSLQSNSNMISFLGTSLNVVVISAEIILVYILASNQYILNEIGISDISLCVSSVSVFVAAFNAMFSNLASIGLMENRMNDFKEYQNMDINLGNVVGEKKIDNIDFVIEFRNVCFSYPNAKNECLHNINLMIKKGDRLAVFGENGAGKTTFIKLLLRLYTPTKGEILLNGINYLEYPIEEFYRLFSTVFQDFVLFAYTIKENIMFDDNMDGMNKERFFRIIDNIGLEGKIKKLTNGIDTYVSKEYDENGESLSGGEGQRIAIARAWYRQAPSVVMDEPTSAIDPISEEKLIHSVAKFLEGKTAIIISHRMSNVRLCNKVIFFDNGYIAECGTHEELMKTGKKYRCMYNTQAKWYVGQDKKN